MVSYVSWCREQVQKTSVLILVVMEDGLVLAIRQVALGAAAVLILVVMEDGLVLDLIRPY